MVSCGMANSSREHEAKTSKGGKLRAAVALGALAAAGYYFYASKNAKKHRNDVAEWARSFKKEVIKQLENAKEINQETIGEAVDRAVGAYQSLKAVDTSELLKAARELKDHWKEFAEDFAEEGKRSVRTVRRGLKRATKDL